LQQDSNSDGRIGGEDAVITRFRRGVYFTGGISYTF
jgi:hypothetical protein